MSTNRRSDATEHEHARHGHGGGAGPVLVGLAFFRHDGEFAVVPVSGNSPNTSWPFRPPRLDVMLSTVERQRHDPGARRGQCNRRNRSWRAPLSLWWTDAAMGVCPSAPDPPARWVWHFAPTTTAGRYRLSEEPGAPARLVVAEAARFIGVDRCCPAHGSQRQRAPNDRR